MKVTITTLKNPKQYHFNSRQRFFFQMPIIREDLNEMDKCDYFFFEMFAKKDEDDQ